MELHHIDGDSSHTTDDNLAVICAEEHDLHTRPRAYQHAELTTEQITSAKHSWERFVEESRKPNPTVLATINLFGTDHDIQAMKLVFQWRDGRVEFERTYQRLDAPREVWIEKALEEVAWLNRTITIAVVERPFDFDWCTTCGTSFSQTIDENMAIRLTAPDWNTLSVCAIYINPYQPSLAVEIAYQDVPVFSFTLHRCGTDLHYMSSNSDQRIPIPSGSSARDTAAKVVGKLLAEWEPTTTLIGSGDPDKPDLQNELTLPGCWEVPT